MSFAEESVIGHQEKLMDPERQIGFLPKYARGEKDVPYTDYKKAVAAARIAIIKAVNIVHATGKYKGERKYDNLDLEEMNAEVDRLEALLKRKDNGENIEKEIDCPISKEEVDERKKELKAAEDMEKKIDHSDTPEKPSTDVTKESDKIIADIQSRIKYAEILLAAEPGIVIDSKKAGKQEIEEIQEIIKRAELEGVDVETQKNKLFDLICSYSDVLESI